MILLSILYHISLQEPMQAIEAEPLMTNPNPRKAVDAPVPIPNEVS